MNELSELHARVLWAAFGVSMVFGWVAQKTHFCTMGAISDIVNMGNWTRMRMWVLAVAVAMLGFYGMGALGWIDLSRTFYISTRIIWLSALVGGALFGFGMVLASGCGSKTLVRIGGGSLKALVVFFIMGVSAFATLRGITAVLRVNTVDTVAWDAPAGSLPALVSHLTGSVSSNLGLVVALLVGGAMLCWVLSSRSFWTLDHLLAGVGVGASVVAMWWVTGYLGYVPEHPETLESVYLATSSGLMESLTFTAPMAYTLDWLQSYSDTSKRLTVGVVSVLGVVVGAFVYSMATRSFRWEGFRDTQDTALHIVGAVLMGIGGVTAMGCTVGQGLSGLSTLSLVSVIAVTGIVLGALGGLRFQLWLVMRDV